MFCRYCGKELLDEAVVCPHCGCLVHEIKTAQDDSQTDSQADLQTDLQPVAQAVEQPVVSRKFYRLKKIFSIVGTALSGVALLCTLFSMWLMLLAFASNDGNGGAIAFAILAIIFWFYFSVAISPFALASGILAFVFGGKTEKRGAFAVTAFVLGIVAFVVAWGAFVVLVI